jgi:hypothetical protein
MNECMEDEIVLQRKERFKVEEQVGHLKIKVKESKKREDIWTSHVK